MGTGPELGGDDHARHLWSVTENTGFPPHNHPLHHSLLVEHGIITAQEREGMDRVLNAAALTYVAAAVSTLLTLLYFLWRTGLLGGRR